MSPAEVVVDASLAVKWVVGEPYNSQACALLDHWRDDGSRLLAPALFLYEVTNALAKRVQRRQLTLEQAKERLRFLQGKRTFIAADRFDPSTLSRTDGAVRSSDRLRHSLLGVGRVSALRMLDRRRAALEHREAADFVGALDRRRNAVLIPAIPTSAKRDMPAGVFAPGRPGSGGAISVLG